MGRKRQMEKVLIVTPFNPKGTGGAETFTKDLALTLSKRFVIHISTLPVGETWQGMNYLKGARLTLKLTRAVNKMKPQQYTKIYAMGLMSSFACYILKLKYSAIMLALYDFVKPNLFTKVLNHAEKVF